MEIAAPVVDLFIWPIVHRGLGSFHEVSMLWPVGRIAEAHIFLGLVDDVERYHNEEAQKQWK